MVLNVFSRSKKMDKRNSNIYFFSTLLMLSSVSFAQSYSDYGREVGFYFDSDFRNKMEIPDSLHNDGVGVPYIGDQFNDKLSSISVTAQRYLPPTSTNPNWTPVFNTCLFLFEHQNYMGYSVTLNSGSANLKNIGFNDKVSSFFITYKSDLAGATCQDTVTLLYEHPDANGPLQPYGSGYVYPVKRGPAGRVIKLSNYNDSISSVKVKSGHCLKMWIHQPPNSSDVTNYNNWYLNPSHVVAGSDRVYNLPNGIANEVSAIEVSSCY
jgi:hypothetical protein